MYLQVKKEVKILLFRLFVQAQPNVILKSTKQPAHMSNVAKWPNIGSKILNCDDCFWPQHTWYIGTYPWYIDILVNLNIAILVPWYLGTLSHWYMVYWYLGTLVYISLSLSRNFVRT